MRGGTGVFNPFFSLLCQIFVDKINASHEGGEGGGEKGIPARSRLLLFLSLTFVTSFSSSFFFLPSETLSSFLPERQSCNGLSISRKKNLVGNKEQNREKEKPEGGGK